MHAGLNKTLCWILSVGSSASLIFKLTDVFQFYTGTPTPPRNMIRIAGFSLRIDISNCKYILLHTKIMLENISVNEFKCNVSTGLLIGAEFSQV